MPLTNVGRDFLAKAIVGDSVTPFDNSNAHIGVGDSDVAFAASQTDLQASSNKLRKAMDVGFPTREGNVLTFQSTYTGAEANFAWEEWGVFNDDSGGEMLDRMVEYNGTKLEGQTWVFKVTLTVSIGT
jgi:hypothetical protein